MIEENSMGNTKMSLTYCGMQGEGPTVKEAKQDAARKLSRTARIAQLTCTVK